MQLSRSAPNRMLDSFLFGLERSSEGSFQRLTRLRNTCPEPTRITLLINPSEEHWAPPSLPSSRPWRSCSGWR
jgi:hypothetical protein